MIIVASGPSARGFTPPVDLPVIAVNGAIDWLSRADYWFSLDPSPANLHRVNNPRPGVEYHVAFPHPRAKTYLRLAKRGNPPAKTSSPEWWLWRWSGIPGICKLPGAIHTGNSSWGALQLAYKLGASKVILVGVDASGHERVEGGKPNNLDHLPLLFNSSLGDIKAVNCGHMVSQLPRMTIEEGVRWLKAS